MVCSKCGIENKSRYHWANLSGNYTKDLKDWVRLCVSCHLKMDRLNCRICQRISNNKWGKKRGKSYARTS